MQLVLKTASFVSSALLCGSVLPTWRQYGSRHCVHCRCRWSGCVTSSSGVSVVLDRSGGSGGTLSFTVNLSLSSSKELLDSRLSAGSTLDLRSLGS